MNVACLWTNCVTYLSVKTAFVPGSCNNAGISLSKKKVNRAEHKKGKLIRMSTKTRGALLIVLEGYLAEFYLKIYGK